MFIFYQSNIQELLQIRLYKMILLWICMLIGRPKYLGNFK